MVLITHDALCLHDVVIYAFDLRESNCANNTFGLITCRPQYLRNKFLDILLGLQDGITPLDCWQVKIIHLH